MILREKQNCPFSEQSKMSSIIFQWVNSKWLEPYEEFADRRIGKDRGVGKAGGACLFGGFFKFYTSF